MRRLTRAASLAALISAVACGSGSPGGATSSAVVSVSLAPDPVSAAPCPPSHCGSLLGEMEVTGRLTLRETAGVAASAQSVAMELRFASGTVSRGSWDGAAITQLAGTTRIGAGAALGIPVAMHFTPAPGLLPATWVVTATVQDDRGNRLTPSVTVAVR